MAKYRKKPVVIEAMQFTDETKEDVYLWASEQQMNIEPSYEDGIPCLRIPTLEGEICTVGDYLIRGIKGEFYPCKPDIFKQTYEEVVE
ncbi:hypothetical protein ACFO6R_10190 [Eubacterium multiforme]|uniref:Phage protein n=1 Tax=Eubacterium multiforme TaxID=83339 RepID=A0ABT9USP7_9FIRM|nr:hypothetical protein [Eubacterium multiforme]MDQ0149346.1 hypothetical protein [Eubacterium multiforme]